jgi:hypothetical protein
MGGADAADGSTSPIKLTREFLNVEYAHFLLLYLYETTKS